MTEPQIPAELDTAEFRTSWKDFLADRTSRGKKATPLAQKKLLKKMKPWGSAKAVLAIQTAIERGWTGLFEPDNPPFMAPWRKAMSEDEALYFAKVRAMDDLGFCGYLTLELEKEIRAAKSFSLISELKADEFRLHEKEVEAWGDEATA